MILFIHIFLSSQFLIYYVFIYVKYDNELCIDPTQMLIILNFYNVNAVLNI